MSSLGSAPSVSSLVTTKIEEAVDCGCAGVEDVDVALWASSAATVTARLRQYRETGGLPGALQVVLPR